MDQSDAGDPVLEEFAALDSDQKNQLLIQMKQFIQQLQVQIAEMEKSAIDIIVEKDEKIAALEALHISRRSWGHEEELEGLRSHIFELNQRIETLQMRHYEQLQEQENKWNCYMLQQIQLSNQEGHNQEKSLLEQLGLLEEKCHRMDREMENYENMEIQMRNQLLQITHQNGQLQSTLEVAQSELQKTLRERELVEVQLEKERQSHNKQLNKLNQHLAQLQRQNQNLKLHIQKVSQQNKEYASTIGEMAQKKQELECQLFQQSMKSPEIVHYETSAIQKTGVSTEPCVKEEINTTAFDLLENDNSDNENESQVEESRDQVRKYEEYLSQSNRKIKEQCAQLQLLSKQLQIIRQHQFNQKNLKEYVKNLENDFVVSKQMLSQKQEQYEAQIETLKVENRQLKLQLKGQYNKLYSKRGKQYQ